jgi:hypothetical protein
MPTNDEIQEMLSQITREQNAAYQAASLDTTPIAQWNWKKAWQWWTSEAKRLRRAESGEFRQLPLPLFLDDDRAAGASGD